MAFLTSRSKSLSSPHVACFLGLEDITGERGEVADIVQTIGQVRRSEAIRQIVWLLSRVDTKRGVSSQFQIHLARQFLDDELVRAVIDHSKTLEGTPWTIFHRQSLWLLLQFVVIACHEDVEDCSEQELRQTIGRCCLVASDCLNQVGEPALTSNSAADELDDAFTSIMISLRDVGNEALVPNLLARARQFWLEIPSKPAVKQQALAHRVDPDVDSVFKRHFGVTLFQFEMVLTICVAFFSKQEDSNPQLLDVQEYFGKANATGIARDVVAIVSQDPGELARRLVNTPRQTWSRDFTPLRQFPLMEVLPGKIACPDVSFLCRMLADGVYWHLVEAYGKDRDRFKTLFGDIFEDYTNSLFGQFGYSGSLLARTLYLKPKFEATADEVCDGILSWPTMAVLAEYKAGLLTTHQKYSGNRDALLRGIDDMLMRHPRLRSHEGSKKGIGQLADSLARILKGERVKAAGPDNIDGPDLSGCTLLPMLVTYEHTLGMHTVQRRAQRKLDALLKQKAVETQRVGPVLLLTLDDIELIEELQSQHSVEYILSKYASHLRSIEVSPVGSFRDFAYNAFAGRNGDSHTFVVANASQLFDQALEELRKYQAKSGCHPSQ